MKELSEKQRLGLNELGLLEEPELMVWHSLR
jgi:hypothetical protein